MSATLVFDIGGSSVKLAVVADGAIVLRPPPIVLAHAHVDEVTRVVLEAIAAMPQYDRVAVSTAGVVDAEGVVTLSGAIAGYPGTAWRALIEDAFPGRFASVLVDNDGRCAAWGEHVAGHGRGVDSLAHVVLGTGLGGGAVIDERLLFDPHGHAQNFGHVAVPVADPAPCGCGLERCSESLAATRGVLSRAPGATIPELAARLRAGDAQAEGAFAGAGRWLGLAIADVVATLQPELVTVGGGLVVAARARGRNVYVEAAQAAAGVPLLESRLGNDAALLGAAALAGTIQPCSPSSAAR